MPTTARKPLSTSSTRPLAPPNPAAYGWPLPLPRDAEGKCGEGRTGDSPLERLALARLEQHLASVPVRTLARLYTWPTTGTDVAEALELRGSAQYYNMLAKAQGRRHGPLRVAFERWAELPGGALDVIDRPRCAIGQRPRDGERDGRSDLEQMALARVRKNLPAMTARMVLDMVLFPMEMPDLASELDVEGPQLQHMLAGGEYSYPNLRRKAAEFMGGGEDYPLPWLDHLIDAPRAEKVPLHEPLLLAL